MTWEILDSESLKTTPNRFLAAIKHGSEYRTVEVKKIGPGCHHVAEGSCIGWRPGHEGLAYWQPLPAPPYSQSFDIIT